MILIYDFIVILVIFMILLYQFTNLVILVEFDFY